MPNRPGNDDRSFGAPDRERQRDVANETGRSASGSKNASHAEGVASGNGAAGTSRRSNRGFASMDRSKQKEIASKGGKAAHAKGTAHEFDSGEAREAGRKGGLAVSQNREHMAKIGRRGGEARGAARGRGAGVANSGASSDEATGGGFQNSRAGMADREVSVEGREGVKANTQGNRGANNSIGGERGNSNTLNPDQSSRGESFGNH
ncbi:MAG TPA: KGG domain-containing protein [Gemmatimonadaceae bacterium]|nr:KGG domain-containing protein [Gemmatimonadaceae bacterium]